MNALFERIKHEDDLTKLTDLEMAIWQWADNNPERAEKAAVELAAKDAEIAELKTAYQEQREYYLARDAALQSRLNAALDALQKADVQLCATQRNWDEDCLFECHGILQAALAQSAAGQEQK